jgi:four helix bundle protein
VLPVNEQEFKDKTRKLAVRIIRMVEALPRGRASDIIGRQLLRSSTSVGANYRAACRARSAADMVAKLAIVVEEADESLYWMELLVEADILTTGQLSEVMNEMNSILAMTVASIKTLKSRNQARIEIENLKPKI